VIGRVRGSREITIIAPGLREETAARRMENLK